MHIEPGVANGAKIGLLDVGLLATLKSYKKRSLPSVFNQRLISVKD